VDPVERLRRIALALPEATEKVSHGEVAFFCRRQFVMLDEHHHRPEHGPAHLAAWCAAAPGVQAELVGSDPGRFFVPPYVGHRGWVGVRLDEVDGRGPDWDEVAEIVVEAYRHVAPVTLRRRLDDESAAGRGPTS
jgi:hypothetical protein